MRYLSTAVFLLLAASAPAVAQSTFPNWTTVATPSRATPPFFHTDILLPSPNALWVFRYTGVRNTTYRELLSSSDNGQTWESTWNTGLTIVDCSPLDNRHAWGVSTGNALFYTSTGASGFSQTAAQVPNAQTVHFFSASTGIVTSMPTAAAGSWPFYRTTDGGTSWQALTGLPPKGAGEGVQLQARLGTHLWAATSQGHLLHTADAGQTWVQYTIPENFSGLSFRDVVHGLAYGSGTNRSLYQTTDGGATWNLVNASGPRYLDLLTAVPGSRSTYLSAALGTGSVGTDYNACSISYDEGQTWQNLLVIRTIETIRSIGANEYGDVWIGMHPDQLLHYTGTALAAHAANTSQLGAAYPNPCLGELQLPAGGNYRRVQVYNMCGRLSFSAVLDATTTSLNLSNLPAGLYQLRLDGGKSALLQQRLVLAR